MDNAEDYTQGKMDGRRDAKGNIAWFASGCCIGTIGIIIPFVIAPQVPTDQLVGKSTQYVQGYTEGYKRKAKIKDAMYAVYGCLAHNLAIYVIIMIGMGI